MVVVFCFFYVVLDVGVGLAKPIAFVGIGRPWWGTFVFLTGFAGLMSLFGFFLMGVLMLMETSRHRSPYA